MSDFNGYAVFFFPNALEALGDAVKAYLQDSPGGPHILCRDIDVGGALAQLTLEGRTTDGRELDLELMFPTSMVRMIVSARTDPAFGFGPRTAVRPARAKAPVVDKDEPGPAHPPGGGTAARKAPKQPSDGKAAKKGGKAAPAKTPAKQAGKKAAKQAPAKQAARKSPAKQGARKAARKTR